MAKLKELKIPASWGACADLYYKLREQRLAMQREVDDVEAQEKQLRDHIIANLPKSEGGAIGKTAKIKLDTKEIPRVEDWDAFYKYVKRTGHFDLMQRRLADGAVKERWENGKPVPGVTKFTAVTISCTKK